MNDKSYLLADYAKLVLTGKADLMLPGNDDRAEQFGVDKSLLGYSGLAEQMEDAEGYPSVGGITIEVDSDKCTTLHELTDGFLEDFDPETQKVYVYAFGVRDGTSKALFFGILQSWTRAKGDKAIILRCVGYLVACQDIPVPANTFPLNDGLAPIIGQGAYYLVYYLWQLMFSQISFSGELPIPQIIAASRFWSFYQHPECRWDYGGTYPDQKGTRSYALDTDGNYLFIIVNDYVIGFTPVSVVPTWHVYGQFSIAGDPLASGEVWRVEEMVYLSTPARLKIMVRKHKSYNAGEGPLDGNYQAHIVEWTL